MPIKGSVGKGGLNDPADVLHVEEQLARHRRWLDPLPAIMPDGTCGPDTIEAIRRFQATAAALYKDDVDGIVLPLGFTIRRLETGHIPLPKHRVFLPVSARLSEGLKPADFERAAKKLGCEPAAIRAVARQEAGLQGAWDSLGRPTILFERHKFGEYSGRIWDKTHRDISNTRASLTRANASKGEPRDQYNSDPQYIKLYRAATLDETAALKSASWGLFQMLGDKHKKSGFPSVDGFVDAMLESEAKHLDVFVSYISGYPALKKAIQDKNWARFALLYNGEEYEKNYYDVNMAKYYRQFLAEDAARAAPPKPPTAVKAK